MRSGKGKFGEVCLISASGLPTSAEVTQRRKEERHKFQGRKELREVLKMGYRKIEELEIPDSKN